MQTAFLLIRCLLCMRSCCIFDFIEIRLTLSVDLNFECFTRAFFLASKFLEMIKILSYALQQRFLDLCEYASSLRLEESLWSRSSHRIRWLEKALWSWSSHSKLSLFFSIFNQSALKIWKSSSWVTQKKHDLMISLFAAFNIESLISYYSQSSIWWLTTDWMTERSNSSSSLFFIFSTFCTEIDELSNFENLLDFLLLSHMHNTQRSIRSNSSLWRCFWHDSVLYVS